MKLILITFLLSLSRASSSARADQRMCNMGDGLVVHRTSYFGAFLDPSTIRRRIEHYSEAYPFQLLTEDCQRCLESVINENDATETAFTNMCKQVYFDMDTLRPMEQKFRDECFSQNVRSYMEFSFWDMIANVLSSFRGSHSDS